MEEMHLPTGPQLERTAERRRQGCNDQSEDSALLAAQLPGMVIMA